MVILSSTGSLIYDIYIYIQYIYIHTVYIYIHTVYIYTYSIYIYSIIYLYIMYTMYIIIYMINSRFEWIDDHPLAKQSSFGCGRFIPKVAIHGYPKIWWLILLILLILIDPMIIIFPALNGPFIAGESPFFRSPQHISRIWADRPTNWTGELSQGARLLALPPSTARNTTSTRSHLEKCIWTSFNAEWCNMYFGLFWCDIHNHTLWIIRSGILS